MPARTSKSPFVPPKCDICRRREAYCLAVVTIWQGQHPYNQHLCGNCLATYQQEGRVVQWISLPYRGLSISSADNANVDAAVNPSP